MSVRNMYLSELIERAIDQDCYVADLQIDSRKVVQGDVFVALTKNANIRDKHIQQALSQGAVGVLVGQNVTTKQSKLYHYPHLASKIPYLAQRRYGKPAINLVGITGTNGKTSIAWMGVKLLEKLGYPCGYIGTLGAFFGKHCYTNTLTTPDCFTLHRILAKMQQQGVSCCLLEVSSHALAQRRVLGLEFVLGVFTNLTHDHLDYHTDFLAYKQAKWLLWQQCQGVIANSNDIHWQDIPKDKLVATYQVGDWDGKITNLNREVFAGQVTQSSMDGLHWQIAHKNKLYNGESPLLGSCMFSNLLACVAIASRLGFSLDAITNNMADIFPPPGRMQVVCQKPFVVVDYAHTPDALQHLLRSLRDLLEAPSRLAVVFGCGGNRDQNKRAMMGGIAARYADEIFITSDNPRSEDPLAIITQITEGIDSTCSVGVQVIVNRKTAIGAAIDWSQSDDVIVVAGKGHESTQQFADITTDFNDVYVVGELLQQTRKFGQTDLSESLTGKQSSTEVSTQNVEMQK